MVKPIEVYFYYMNDCGWCDKFKPTWEKMKNNNNITNIIALKEKERSEMSNNDQMINGEQIDGYPTIKIVINTSGTKKEYKYGTKSEDSECKGDRSCDDILLCIKEQLEEELKNVKMREGKQKLRYASRLRKNELFISQI